MQPKLSPLILATAALGVLALGGLAYVFLSPGSSAPPPNVAQAGPTPTPKPSMLWVAARDIPPRTRITGAMIAKVAYTGKDAVPADSIQDISQVSNEITSEPIFRGQPIKLTSLTAGVARKTPADIEIPAGFRAVAIYVNPTETAAGLIDVGDYVDVIAVHKLSLDKEKNQAIVGAQQFSAGRLIGTDLKVLAVGDPAPAATPTPLPAAPGANVETGPPVPPTPAPPPSAAPQKVRVLLAAPVEIATRLVAAGDQGSLHVTIRNPMDGDQTASPEVREYPSRLVTQKEISTTAKEIGKAYGDGLKSSLGPIPPMPSMMPPVQVPTMAPPMLEPMKGLPSATPSGTPTTDVTVIRGTEKMRVIVPQR